MAVVQVVMLYWSETWVMTLRIERVLDGFHHKLDHRLTRRQHWIGREDGWVYSPMEKTIVESRLQEVETYVSHRQNTVAQFIATRPIKDLCLAAARRQESRVSKQRC